MTATLRLLLLTTVLAYCLVFGATSGLAAQVKAQRNKALRFKVHPGSWLHFREAKALPIGVRAAAYARRFLGVPYRWGGSSPGGFDCSGLVRYVYQRFGVTLPHSSYADFNLGRHVGRWALKPGDLVFFSGFGHVGMYVGQGRFIHAPHSGTSVQISSLAQWGSSYVGARRLLHG
jgi:cell wall-associated NlpC family hydrolase